MTACASRLRTLARAALVPVAVAAAGAAFAEPAYTPISPSRRSETVVLTGRDLSIEEIVRVARYGARVEVSDEARQRESDNYGLLLEAAAEGVPVYWFNRGIGDQREVVIFDGDALAPKTRPQIEQRQAAAFASGATIGTGPEVAAEEVVRAMMVVRANSMTFNAPSPPLAQMLLELLNHRITPVVQSRGTLGEADLFQLAAVRGRRQCALQQQCLRHRAGGARCCRWPRGARMGGPDLRDGSRRHEQQHHAAQRRRAARPPGALAQLARGTRARHAERQLPLRCRSEAGHPGPGEPAGFLDPAGLGVGGLGGAARRGASAGQLLRPQSGDRDRRRAGGLAGARDQPADAVLREGRRLQPRAARIHPVECELGPVSARKPARKLRDRAREHGRCRGPADRAFPQYLLHGRLRAGCAEGRRNGGGRLRPRRSDAGIADADQSGGAARQCNRLHGGGPSGADEAQGATCAARGR